MSISMHALTTAPLPHRYEPALEPAMLPEIERGVKAWRGRQALPPRLDSALNLGQHRRLECRLVPVGKGRRGEHVHADAP